MFLESRIRELCDQIATCSDDTEIVMLTDELRAALHEHVQNARGKLLYYPHLQSVFSDAQAAS